MEAEKFDNEKFFLEKVVLAVNYVRNDLPEPFKNDIVYYDEDGKFIFSITKNGNVWFNYDTIWSVFESKNNWNYTQTQEFLNDMFEKHWKMKGVTARPVLRHLYHPLEKHFRFVDVNEMVWKSIDLKNNLKFI